MTTITRTDGLIGQLNHEWQTLGEGPSPTHWSDTLALAGHGTPQDVLVANRGGGRAETDARLHALISLAQDGDLLAGRTLIQAMLGKLVRLSRTAKMRGLPDPFETTVAAAWEAITSYPLRRTKSVAGCLSLDTLSRIPAAQHFEVSLEPEDLTPLLSADPSAGDDTDPTELVIEILTWAQDHDALSTDEVRLLARKYLADEPRVTLATIAEEFGEPLGTICSRHQRAVARLTQAAVRLTQG